ncbi:MAG TPA: hypothetical protein VNS58_12850 [Puia sp.]|nr:hypothetical protein [Puia sp.]
MEKDTQLPVTKIASKQESSNQSRFLKQAPSSKSYLEYLYGENKIYSLLILFLVTCQFIIFKLLYPFPDFFSDSYSYLYAAYAHLDVNIWPIGYSKFLSIFHSLTHSAIALTFFQYIFLEISCLYFYHTVVYHFQTGRNTRTFLCLFLFFNPLNLYIANYVSSDSIFIAISLIWITQLFWIYIKPQWYQIPLQGILFIIAFSFRYNASYYPLVATIVFLVSGFKLWYKILGLLLGPSLLLCFILFSRHASEKMLGSPQFPPILGGWQWGNNALYMREQITEDTSRWPNKNMAELDSIARDYFRWMPPRYRDLDAYVANFFIREPQAPLKTYLISHYKIEDGTSQVVAWGKVAPIFGEYGKYIIKRHPIEYMRYYLFRNVKNYFMPPLEKLEIYNLGDRKFRTDAQYWFDLHSDDAKCVSKELQGTLLFFFPSLFGVINLYFLISLIFFIRSRGFQQADRRFSYAIGLVTLFWLLNFCFSVFANIIVIRYQVFPMIILISSAMLLTDYLESIKKTVTAKNDVYPSRDTKHKLGHKIGT